MFFRFLPDGIYLDACALGPEKLARQMDNAILVKRKYYEFFKWHAHYSFHSASEKPNTDPICELCALLNNVTKMTATSIHRDTSKWWNQFAIMSNLTTCTVIRDTINAVEPTKDDMESLSIINSLKNVIVEVIPELIQSTLTILKSE